MIEQLTPNTFLINSAAGGVAVSVKGVRDTSFGAPHIHDFDSLEHVRWGAMDNEPNSIRRVIEKNSIVRSLLDTMRDMVYGKGVRFYAVNYEGGKSIRTPFMDTKLAEWCEATDLDEYVLSAINTRLDNANIFTRWEYDLSNDWFNLAVSDSFNTRIAKANNNKSAGFFTNPYFGEQLYSYKDSMPIAAFHRNDRTKNKLNVVSISHTREPRSGQPFYDFPSYWCAQESIELANLIVAFHKNGIMNGYNIKYLIRMPADYFDKDGKKNADEKEIKERWRNFSSNLSSWMSGVKQVNKTMLIKYLRGSDGKMLDNVDIIPLKNEMSDDAYEKVWDMANRSISNSVGVLPTLGGVNPGKGNDSGSQIRVMADYQQHFRTPIHRMLVLKDVNRAIRDLGYKNVIADFDGVQITTLDVNPAGTQSVTNNDPTNV
ncbi:MAG: hypothetical protein LCH91_05370 [Bacteroidetes bacterium]|nr:hypothetical protein [Bacteroidota bacterium]